MSIKNLTSGFVVTPSPTGTSHDFRVDLIDEDDFNVLTQGDRSKSYEINGNADDNTITGGDCDMVQPLDRCGLSGYRAAASK